MPDDTDGSDRELLAFVRGEIRHESGMLSSRLSAFLASQSFLLIAYGSTMSGSLGEWQTPFTLLIPPALALLGFVLAVYALVGVRAAPTVLAQWHARQDELMDGNAALDAYRPAVPGGPGCRRRRRDRTPAPARNRVREAHTRDPLGGLVLPRRAIVLVPRARLTGAPASGSLRRSGKDDDAWQGRSGHRRR